MPLRQILNSIADDHHKQPIGQLIRSLVDGIKSANGNSDFCIWLAEECAKENYLFYSASRRPSIPEDGNIYPVTRETKIEMESFSNQLREITGNLSSTFVPIMGMRFGQKSDSEYLTPKYKLVGALETPINSDMLGLRETADLCATVLWNHRSSRFLRMENEISQLLRKARRKTVDWKLAKPIILKLTHSDRFAVFARIKGKITDRLDGDTTILGADFYRNRINEYEAELESGRWQRCVTPHKMADGSLLFWMMVPLKTSHFKHKKRKLKATDKVQHYVVLETAISKSPTGRFLYSSADRRLVEHSLTKFLDGIAEYRIDEVTREIADIIPGVLPNDPSSTTKEMLYRICDRVYDVCDVCVVNPSIAMHEFAEGGTEQSTKSAIYSNKPFPIGRDVLTKLLDFNQGEGSYLSSKHVEVVKIDDRSGLVFSVGGKLVRRFMIFVFNEPYSSYVTTEICSRLAARLQLFLQSCELQSDRTASLTQIAHVLRGPVSSALEELKAIVRDRRAPQLHKIQFQGALSEDEKLAVVINGLSRSRSITDSAKYLLNEQSPNSFQRRKVNVLSILGEVRANLEVDRRQKNMSILVIDRLTRTDNDAAYIWGDEDMLWLLIYNLMENAIKYGRRNSEVKIALESIRNDQVRLSVENTGDLIWDFDKERIFIPYQRALNTLPMNGRQGTGIGLPAANQIALAFSSREDSNGIQLQQSSNRTDKNVTGQISFDTIFDRAR